MHRPLLFFCLNLSVTWGISACLDKDWSNLVCISISSWLILDRLLVGDSVLQDEVDKMRAENKKLKQDALLLELDLRRQELKTKTLKTLKGSSCKF